MKKIINTDFISNRSIMSDEYDRSGSGREDCLRDALYTDNHTDMINVQMSLDNFTPMRVRVNRAEPEIKINLEEPTDKGVCVIASMSPRAFYSQSTPDLVTSMEAISAMCIGSHLDKPAQFVLHSRKTNIRYDWVSLSNALTKTYCSYFKAKIPTDIKDLHYEMKSMYEVNNKPAYMILRTDMSRQAKLIALYTKRPKFDYKIVPMLQELMSVPEDKTDFIVLRYKFCQAYAEIIFTYKMNILAQRFVEADRACVPAFKLYLNYGSGDKVSYIESGMWFNVNGNTNGYYEPDEGSSLPISNGTNWHEIINSMTDQIERRVEEKRVHQNRSIVADITEIRHYIDEHLDRLANKVVDRRALKTVDRCTKFTNCTVLKVLEVVGTKPQVNVYTINIALFRCLEDALNTYKSKCGKNKSVDDLFDHVLSKIFLD